jgi:hypothetical protein
MMLAATADTTASDRVSEAFTAFRRDADHAQPGRGSGQANPSRGKARYACYV